MLRQTGRDVLLLALDSLFKALPVPVRRKRGDVLITRLDGIGDFLLWLDAARALRERYAGRHITLVLSSSCYELARRLPYFDEVIPVRRQQIGRSLAYRYRVFLALRRRRYRLAVHPVHTRIRRFRDSEAVMRMVRAKRKVGSAGGGAAGWRKTLADRWYTDLVPAAPTPLTELERTAEFMRGFGFPDFHARVPELPRQHLPSPPAGAYYVLFVGAGAALRRWPVQHFAELARCIYRATGWTGIVGAGPGEEELGQALVQAAGVPLRDCVGTTTLPELAALIAGAQVLVSNETGAVHLAATVSTPSVCILGGGHHGRFLPYRVEPSRAREEAPHRLPVVVTHPMPCFHCDWHCVHRPAAGDPAPCIAQISVESVWRQVVPILERVTASKSANIASSG